MKVSHESKFDVEYVNMVKYQVSRYFFSKGIVFFNPFVFECLILNIRKQIDCKRPSSTKQMSTKYSY